MAGSPGQGMASNVHPGAQPQVEEHRGCGRFLMAMHTMLWTIVATPMETKLAPGALLHREITIMHTTTVTLTLAVSML